MADLFREPTGDLEFVPLAAEHFFAIAPQASQRTQYGVAWEDMAWGEAEAIARQANCWAAIRGEWVLAILGINENFPGTAGVAFAVLAAGLARDHHRITRFAREEVIGKSDLTRIEAIVRCADVDGGSPAWMLAQALRDPTPQVRWAVAVGLSPVAVLRKFGAASETHLLLERVQ